MPRSYRYLQYDVFTDRLFGGNQLAVFTEARGLSAETMQSIAKEMNFSESTFVLPPDEAGTDFRLRIFTPGTEMPMAGHPTIGSAFALARVGVLETGRAAFVFGLPVGPTQVSMTWQGRDVSSASMVQPRPTFSAPVADREGAARALGLSPGAVTSNLPIQVVSCGVPYLLIPLATRAAVDQATSRADAIKAYSDSLDVAASGIFLFSVEPAADQATLYSRMFAPVLGVNEDPATGSASGPAGCYLVRHGLVPSSGAGSIVNRQGVAMGRPSTIHVAVGVDGAEITSVQVGGEAVLAGEGLLYIP
jgi:trans-2,3-dihydro-3-hydroxyanthranilate isomerase